MGGNSRERMVLMSYEKVGQAIGQLVDEKNKSHGSAFEKAGDFLKRLYPDGVKPEQYTDMLAIVRVFDKMMRIATDKDAFGEDPWRDIAGYAILLHGLNQDKANKSKLFNDYLDGLFNKKRGIKPEVSE